MPLARDASIGALQHVIAAIHVGVATDEQRAELYTAPWVMAAMDLWGTICAKS